MEAVHLVPPVAFAIVLGSVCLQSWGMNWFAPRHRDRSQPSGKLASYACGEHVEDHRSQPNYAQFFHFAFFFTVMHVVALVVATLPAGSPGAAALGAAMLAGASVSLFVLFRR